MGGLLMGDYGTSVETDIIQTWKSRGHATVPPVGMLIRIKLKHRCCDWVMKKDPTSITSHLFSLAYIALQLKWTQRHAMFTANLSNFVLSSFSSMFSCMTSSCVSTALHGERKPLRLWDTVCYCTCAVCACGLESIVRNVCATLAFNI